MNIREVKAYIHRNRIGDVVNGLHEAGFRNLTVIDIEGIAKVLDRQEQRYSVEIAQKVNKEVRLELVCDNETRTAEAVTLIREHARTGQPSAGWIYITDIQSVIEIVD